jgi:predicted RNA binding protein YcfA (HicA-like mRNA interferase family)
MPKLYSSSHILKVLDKHGFVFISQKGSHIKLRKSGEVTLTVIVPANRKRSLPERFIPFYVSRLSRG